MGQRKKVERKQKSVVLYRGTAYPEDFPELRDYACIFFAVDPYSAANYGDFVQAYDVGTPRLIVLDSKLGDETVRRFIDSRTYLFRKDVDQRHELSIHPTGDWIIFLSDLGYDGYAFEFGICLFEAYVSELPVRLIDRQKLEVR